MLNSFEPAAAAMIESASSEAQKLGHAYVGAEHLLLAFTASPGSDAAQYFAEFGLTYEVLRTTLVEMFGQGESTEDALRLNSACRSIIQNAQQMAASEKATGGSAVVTCDHLFLAFLLDNGGLLESIMRRRGRRSAAVAELAGDQAIAEKSAVIDAGWIPGKGESGDYRELIALLQEQPTNGQLGPAFLQPTDFLPFLTNLQDEVAMRNFEAITVSFNVDRISPSYERSRYAPAKGHFEFFDGGRYALSDHFCYLVLSSHLCFVLFGQRVAEGPEDDRYWCIGSLHPQTVRAFCRKLMINLRNLDERALADVEALRGVLESAEHERPFASAAQHAEMVRKAWRVCTAPPVVNEIAPPALPVTLTYSDQSFIRQAINQEIPHAQGDFSEAANFVLLFARVEAATYNFASGKADSACLLAGLVVEHAGTASKMLRLLGANLKGLRARHAKDSSRNVCVDTVGAIQFDGEVRKLIASARKLCRADGSDQVQTMHLLSAIVSSGSSEALRALSALDFDSVWLKNEVQKRLRDKRPEGSIADLKLDALLYNALVGEDAIELDVEEEARFDLPDPLSVADLALSATAPGVESAVPPDSFTSGEISLEGKNIKDVDVEKVFPFDMSRLEVNAFNVLEVSLKRFERLGTQNFAARHLLLGIIADADSKASQYLRQIGVSTALVKQALALADTGNTRGRSGRSPRAASTLSGDMRMVLTDAGGLAEKLGHEKISTDFITWALFRNDDANNARFFRALGLNQMALGNLMEHLCTDKDAEIVTYSPRFASISQQGLHVFAILSEPSVGAAMQTALMESERLRHPKVSADFVLLGLLQAPGRAAEILKALKIDAETMLTILQEKIPEETGQSETIFDDNIENAFYRALASSLLEGRSAIDTGNVLKALVEAENPAVLSMLASLKISPHDVLRVILKNTSSKDLQAAENLPERNAVSHLILPLKGLAGAETEYLLQAAEQLRSQNSMKAVDSRLILQAMIIQNPDLRTIFAKYGDLPRRFSDASLSLDEVRKQTATSISILDQAVHYAQALDAATVEPKHIALSLIEHHRFYGGLFPAEMDIAALERDLYLYDWTGQTTGKTEFLVDKVFENLFSHLEPAGKNLFLRAALLVHRNGRAFINVEDLFLAYLSSPCDDLQSCFDDCVENISREQRIVLVNDQIDLFFGTSLASKLNQVGCSHLVLETVLNIAAANSGGRVKLHTLFSHIVSRNQGLMPILLALLGRETAAKLQAAAQALAGKDDAFSWFASAPRSVPLGQKPSRKDDGKLNLDVFDDETIKILHRSSQACSDGAIKPVDLLWSILGAYEFGFLLEDSEAKNESGINKPAEEPSSGSEEEADNFHAELSEAAKKVLVSAFLAKQLQSPGSPKIRPEHLLLAILKDPDADCTALMEKMQISTGRAELLVLGYINRKGRLG